MTSEFSISEEIAANVNKLKESEETSWSAVKYKNKVFESGGTGSDWTEVKNLCQSDLTLFIFLRIGEKYGYFVWNGQNIKPLVRSKIVSNYVPKMKDFAEKCLSVKFAVDHVIVSADELTEDKIRTKLFGVTRRQRGMTYMAPLPFANKATPSSSANGSNATSGSGSGSGSGSSNSSNSFAPQKPRTGIKKMFSQVLSLDTNVIETTCKEIHLTKKRWCVLAYDDEGVCRVVAQGEEDTVEPAKSHLIETDIQYIVIKMNVGDVMGYGSDTEKALFVAYEGTKTGSLRRGKVNQHVTTVYNFVQKTLQLAGQFSVLGMDELNDNALKNFMIGSRGNSLLSPRSSGSRTPRTPRSSTPRGTKATSSIFTTNLPTVTKKKTRKLETGNDCIRIENDQECLDKIIEMSTDDNFDTLWMLFGYEGKNISSLKMLTSSNKSLSDSTEELSQYLNDTSLLYLIIKIYTAVGSERARIKYLMVTWKGMKIKSYFATISVNHTVKLKNTICKLIRITADYTVSRIEDLKENKLLVADRILNMEEAKVKIQNSKKSPILFGSSAVSKTQGNSTEDFTSLIKDVEATNGALRDLNDDSSSTDWIMMEYVSWSKINFTKKGDSGLEGVKNEIKDGEIYFILWKTLVEETGYGGSPKIVLIHYIGKGVKATKKASSASHKISLMKFCGRILSIASEYQASGIDDLDSGSIKAKVTGIKGKAHGVVTSPTLSPIGVKKFGRFGGKSQNLQIDDETKAKEALSELQSDTSPINWLLFKYEGEMLKLVDKGEKGLSEFAPLLKEKEVAYVLYKLLVEETGYGGSPKVILITHVGKQVFGMAKAKSSTHRLQLKDYASKIVTVASEFQEDEVTDAAIRGKLTGSKGKLQQGDTFVHSSQVTTPGSPVKVNQAFKQFGGRDSTLGFKDEKAVINEINDLKNNQSDTKWLVFGYEDDDPYKVKVLSKGPGGVSKFKHLLDNDHVYYILMRLAVIEYSGSAKVVLVTWVGENVPSFHKSRSSGHRINLYEYARSHMAVGGEFAPQDLDSLTDEALMTKITGGKSEQGEAKDDANKGNSSSRWEQTRVIQPKVVVKDNNLSLNKLINFQGKESIKQNMEEFAEKSKTEELDFLVLEVTGKGFRTVQVHDKGKGALSEEWREKYLSPTGIYFFILSIATSERGYGNVITYMFIQWIGKGVKHLHAGLASEIRWSVYKFCDDILHIAGEMQGCNLPEHVTRSTVMEKLSGTKLRGKEMKLEKLPEQFKDIGKKKTKLKYKDEMAIENALAELIKEEGEINWIGVKYVDNSIDELEFHKMGKGGIEEFTQECKDDSIYFIVHKIMHAFGYQRDFEDLLAKPYYGLFHWQGLNVPTMHKALSSHHWNNFANTTKKKLARMKSNIQGSAFFAERVEEITKEQIKKIMCLYD